MNFIWKEIFVYSCNRFIYMIKHYQMISMKIYSNLEWYIIWFSNHRKLYVHFPFSSPYCCKFSLWKKSYQVMKNISKFKFINSFGHQLFCIVLYPFAEMMAPSFWFQTKTQQSFWQVLVLSVQREKKLLKRTGKFIISR